MTHLCVMDRTPRFVPTKDGLLKSAGFVRDENVRGADGSRWEGLRLFLCEVWGSEHQPEMETDSQAALGSPGLGPVRLSSNLHLPGSKRKNEYVRPVCRLFEDITLFDIRKVPVTT